MSTPTEASSSSKDHPQESLSPKVRQRNRVQFHSRKSIEQVQRISRVSQCYSPDEIMAVWGDSDEFQLRKQELRDTVKRIQHGRRASDNMTSTTLGLNNMYGAGRQQKKINRVRAVGAVLQEQDVQYAYGDHDPNVIADIYQDTTRYSKDKAKRDAARIQAEVQGFVNNVGARGLDP